jgi:hypothetical protein
MDESDASTHDDEDGRRTDGSLARIRLWTRAISSQLQDPVNVDEAPVTGRITDLSSIVARYVCPFHHTVPLCSSATRTHSPPTPITPNNRNATRQSNHVNQSNGQSARASVQFSDRVERSRYLAAKYGIDLIEPEWARPVREQVQRVERSIRMRIRYWCHHCNTQYTNSRICSQCSHQRCNRCERQPPRRTTPRFRLADANRTNYILSTENLYVGSIGEHVPNTTLPISQSPSTAFVPQPYANSSRDPFGRRTEAVQGLQQEAVTSPGRLEPHPGRINKPFRVRVHYTCHECQNPFPPKESNCSACGHELCKDCPRNPPRREHRRTSPDNKALERVLMPLGSASDDDDEDGKGKPKIPRSRVQSPPPPSAMIEGIRTRDTAVEPAEPPPPV